MKKYNLILILLINFIFFTNSSSTTNTNDKINVKTNPYEFVDDVIFGNFNLLDFYPDQSPIKDINAKITSGFGLRMHPIYKKIIFHKGVDIGVRINTNVYAPMNGIVTKVEKSKNGYGNNIIIKNSAGFEILLGHLSKNIYVSETDIVYKGQLIAKSGNTGMSTGPHLHYEIHKNKRIENPLKFFHLNNNLIVKN
ncbi:MAG TPA: M23 family metallopeptidase [archaeon]|nr:M23 family metallopeptidase [archaeon]